MLISLLFAGMLASLTHCALLCAPVVALQMKQGGIHLPAIHAGRITLWAAMGGTASFMAHWLFSDDFAALSHLVLIAAGIVFIASALKPAYTASAHGTSIAPGRVWQHYMQGLLLGFVPCGMLTAALMLSATLSPFEAIFGMACFGIGTVPLMQLSCMGVRRLSFRHQAWAMTAGRGLMAIQGLVFCALGLQIVS